jgi:hypothetical protein
VHNFDAGGYQTDQGSDECRASGVMQVLKIRNAKFE